MAAGEGLAPAGFFHGGTRLALPRRTIAAAAEHGETAERGAWVEKFYLNSIFSGLPACVAFAGSALRVLPLSLYRC